MCAEAPGTESLQLPSLHYMLFAYREQLRRRHTQFLKISAIKLHLTDNLILQTMRNIQQYDTIEIMNLSREIDFKRQLYKQMKKVHKLEKLGLRIDAKSVSEEKWY